MKTFLQELLDNLIKDSVNFEDVIFILPNKRAALFLKQALSEKLNKTIFSPKILSTEEFISELSQLKKVDKIELLFEFYKTYVSLTPIDQTETFDQFSSWAQILINDYIEIDRYIINPAQIFDYLSAIKDIDHWSFDKNQTEHISNYLKFWRNLKHYYTAFNEQLLSKGAGHQGLQYREAVNNIQTYIENNNKHHIFVGFNALNKAEEIIIQELLSQNIASVYWDIDEHFYNNKHHDAGYFLRKFKTQWPYFTQHPFNFISNNFVQSKNIQVFGATKTVGQVKQIGAILKEIYAQTNSNLEHTAVVLGDEQQLLPLLSSLPSEIEHINITMGLPLKTVPLSSLFEQLFYLHKNSSETYYYKDVIAILSHSSLKQMFTSQQIEQVESFVKHITKNNLSYFSFKTIEVHLTHDPEIVKKLFSPWNNDPLTALKNCVDIILKIQSSLNQQKVPNTIELSNLYQFYTVFNKLVLLHETYQFINSIQILFGLYKELLNNESVDFKGEPLKGLQIMGVLESRLLDFETVIISGVNEGVLPAGKQHNSFIPYDVKIENSLPTFKEKDAIYTYHFYRLIQRAKNVYIIYNTDPDVLVGGEPSRFIKQLEVDGAHKIKHYFSVADAQINAVELKTVKKTPQLIEDLKALALKGFSPSSLGSYIRNPIDFYYSKVLKINAFEEVEETVAANTLGNVLHKTLEEFYTPFKNQQLQEFHIKQMLAKIDETVSKHFKTFYFDGDFKSGKNLITFEVAKRYIHNFLKKELELIKAGDSIIILDLEKETRVNINIPELDFPIYLNGVVDRIDLYNGTLRIIDYKSGKVVQAEVEIVNWEDLTEDYKKFSKSFQLLTYAYILNSQGDLKLPANAGIVSFKNLQDALVLLFSKKDKQGNGATKDSTISEETLEAYFIELKKLLIEIFNPEVDFIEKTIETF